MKIGYARVSTKQQDLTRQLDALRAHGIGEEHIFVDKKTGATFAREGFEQARFHAREGDVIVAANLDRFGRNLRECLNTVHELQEAGIGVRTLKDPLPVDTSDDSAMGQIAVALLALFAEMERTFMLERAAAARKAREARGERAGPAPKTSVEQRAAMVAMWGQDTPVDEIAAAFGVSRATVYRELAKHRAQEQETEAPNDTVSRHKAEGGSQPSRRAEE